MTTNDIDDIPRAALAAAMNGDEDSPFEPAVFHFPHGHGDIIIAIDAQKPWESVGNYGTRVIMLIGQQGLCEAKNPELLCRVFLGGLRPTIRHAVLVLRVVPRLLTFRQIFFFAQFLENSTNDDMRVMALGDTPPPKWKANVKPDRPSIRQDGLEFFGEVNKSVDVFYQCGTIESRLKILYRR